MKNSSCTDDKSGSKHAILAILTASFPFGTGESFLCPEIINLTEHFDNVIVLPAIARGEKRTFQIPSITVLRIGVLSWSVLPLALRTFFREPLRTLASLARILTRASSVRVLIKNLIIFPKSLATAQALFDRNVTHIHAHWLSTPSTIALIAGYINKTNWSVTTHRWDLYENNLIATKLALACFCRCISEKGKNELTRMYPRWVSRLIVVHLGVHCGGRSPDKSINSKPLEILYPARLDPLKGHRYFLLALSQLANEGFSFRCTFAGAGPARSSIERLVAELDLRESVTIGAIDHDILLSRLGSGNFDLAALTSGDRSGTYEGIPVGLMEAMEAGLPCVATRTGAVPELVNEFNGILVEPENSTEIYAALKTLMVDKDLRGRLGRAARKTILDGFDAKKTSGELSKLILGTNLLL